MKKLICVLAIAVSLLFPTLAHATDPSVLLGVPKGGDPTCTSGDVGFWAPTDGSGLQFCIGATDHKLSVNAEGIVQHVILCGDLPNNGTVYTSPVSGFASGALYAAGATANDLSYAIAGTGCAAEDNATEATADEVLFTNNAFRVIGLFCEVTSSGSNGVTINLRSATANLTPDISVTIPTGQKTAAVATATTTDIAAGATFAAKVVTTEDLSAQDFWCDATIVVIP